MFRSGLFILGLAFSFIISSCGNELKQDRNLNLLTNSSDQSEINGSNVINISSVSTNGLVCDRNIYGDECSNPENFVLVKKEEVKPEYIKAGTSIGGVNGTIIEGGTVYSECSSDGQLDCLSTQTYKAINLSNHISKIVSSENIFGVFGNYTIPSSNEILTGTTYGPNNSLSGSLAYCDSESNTSNCYVKTYSGNSGYTLKALDYDDIASRTSYIENDYVLVSDITGTQSVCGNGSTNCYINGNTYKAVVSNDLIASNIKTGESIGGVDGSYAGSDYSNCTSGTYKNCIAVNEYPSVPSTITSSLLSSVSVKGTPGSIGICTVGSSSCYIDGDSLKAVESANLIAENIKFGVSLGGIIGTYPSDTSPLNGATVTQDLEGINFNNLMVNNNNFEWFDSVGTKYTRAGDTNIVASNIRKGVDIFGVEGSYGDPIPNPEKGVGTLSGAFALKKKDGTVVCFGNSTYGGNCSEVSGLKNVANIFSAKWGAFAALKLDGTVVTWGYSSYGGDSSSVSSQLTDVVNIFSTGCAFAALKDDGSVVTWGNNDYGGDSSSPIGGHLYSGVVNIFSTNYAFAALKDDGSVVTWGFSSYGGDSSLVQAQLTNIVKIFSNCYAFAALTNEGNIVTWGDSNYGGYSGLYGSFVTIFSGEGTFAALTSEGEVVTWGDDNTGGDSSSELLVGGNLSSGVIKIFYTEGASSSPLGAFAALKSDGTVVTWGLEEYGGDSSSVQSLLKNVVDICSASTSYRGGAFAALKSDGTVVAWGDSNAGGNIPDEVKNQLTNVVKIFSTKMGDYGAFAALKADGTVVTWGNNSAAGNTSNVITYTGDSGVSDIVNIFSSDSFFVGVRENDTYVVWGSY